MYARILAVDAGYANVGLVIMEYRKFAKIEGGLPEWHWWPLNMGVIQTEHCDKRLGLRKADDNARRIAEAVRGILPYATWPGLLGIVSEMPSSGGQNALAVQGMAYATAMIVTLAECLKLPIEYYTQQETRSAAAVPKNIIGRAHVKKIVMERMGLRYPELIAAFPTLGRREHAADALATFEAARHGVLVRAMEAVA